MLILIVVLSLLSVRMLPSPAHGFSCPTSYASNKVDGCVISSSTGNPVSGLWAFIVDCGNFEILDSFTTNTNGYFSFQTQQGNGSPCILPNQAYPVSVNGLTPISSTCCDVVGVQAYDPTWGQWAGDVQTDGNGYGSVVIQLDPAQIVNVPAAVLYSNTPLASMDYSMSTSSGSGISIGVSLGIGGATVQAGFESSVMTTSMNGLTQPANSAGYLGQPSYAIDYYCAGSTSYYQLTGWKCSPGLQTVGVSAPALQSNGQPFGWSGYSTSEHLNPNFLPDPTKIMDCWYSGAPGQQVPKPFTWTTSSTNTLGVSDTLGFRGVSATLSFSFSNTQGTSDTNGVTFRSPTGFNNQFRLYPAGGTCANLTFGSELHIWMADFSITSNPYSLGITLGSQQQNSITVSSIAGFTGSVTLTQSPSSSAVSCTFPGGANSITLSLPSDGSSSTSPVCAGSGPAGSYSDTFTATSGPISHSVNVPITITDFNVTAPNVSFTACYSTSRTVNLSGLQGFGGTVNLGVSAPNGLTASCPSSVSIPSGGTVTPCCSYSSSTLGAYTVTITGTYTPTNEYYDATITHS